MENISAICSYSDLKKLEVINLDDGKNYGYVRDIELDLLLGRITAIFVPKRECVISFPGKDNKNYVRIPYSDVEKIGNDTILCRIKEFL